MYDKQNKKKYMTKYYQQNRQRINADITSRNRDTRRNNKQRAVKMLGGKCCKCGYNKCLKALEFHHPDDNKEKNISKLLWSWNKLIVEIKKCILICSNCHKEMHA